MVAGVVDVATGGDQGGSVRIPSAYSGTVGHKPTYGLVPYTGAFPIEQTIDHVGPMTRTVADAALVLNVIAGPGRARPPPARATSCPTTTWPRWPATPSGLRVGVVTEGFGHPNSEPAVDDTVRAAAETLRGAGLAVEDVSIPWHRHGARIWDVIATEGATAQMVDGNGYGMNWKGLYDPEVIEHYGGQWRADGTQFSETVKLVLLTGGLRGRPPPRQALRDGAEPRLRAARGLRRGAVALRRAGHAHAADAGHRDPGARRAARGDPPARRWR